MGNIAGTVTLAVASFAVGNACGMAPLLQGLVIATDLYGAVKGAKNIYTAVSSGQGYGSFFDYLALLPAVSFAAGKIAKFIANKNCFVAGTEVVIPGPNGTGFVSIVTQAMAMPPGISTDLKDDLYSLAFVAAGIGIAGYALSRRRRRDEKNAARREEWAASRGEDLDDFSGRPDDDSNPKDVHCNGVPVGTSIAMPKLSMNSTGSTSLALSELPIAKDRAMESTDDTCSARLTHHAVSWGQNCLLGFFLLAATLAWGYAFPRSAPLHESGGSVLPADGPAIQNLLHTRRVEDMRVGMRVLGTNPLRHEVDDSPEPTPDSWQQIELAMEKPGGKRLDITLLRPYRWMQRLNVETGVSIQLDLEEFGASGLAEVVAIRPCPTIETGPGQVVTGTFIHEPDGNLVDVWIEGLDKPIGCTSNHRFWSETRRAFIAAVDLSTGEVLRSRTGSNNKVAMINARPVASRVYNLEVGKQHVYEVSPAGVLVHNSYLVAATEAGDSKLIDIVLNGPDGKQAGILNATYLKADETLQLQLITLNKEFQNKGHGFNMLQEAITAAGGNVRKVTGQLSEVNLTIFKAALGTPVHKFLATPSGGHLTRLGFSPTNVSEINGIWVFEAIR